MWIERPLKYQPFFGFFVFFYLIFYTSHTQWTEVEFDPKSAYPECLHHDGRLDR
jgi:hypothetical protein